MEVPSSWDALRKQARKLEAQLDEQMNSYRRVVSTKVTTKNDTSENDLESGIDRLLKQLQQVNSQMQAWVSSGGSEMVSHTLTRHQEILQDLTQEFYRLRSSLRAKQEHASLLEDFREFDRTRLDLEEGVGSAEQALLKENASISRSTGQGLGLNNLRWVEINHGFRGSLIFVEGKSVKDLRKCTNFLPLFIGYNVRIPFQLISNDTAQFSIA
ncbi:Golgi SNAP receptor complex member 1-1 [Quercus suber]|uniref:Golgi SNAP receptor complex member 1-1 n=1 Tax=Quercus suber TaxID=58331 RepID=UPI0032DF1A39